MWFEHGEEGIVVGVESITYSTSVCSTVGRLELVVGRVRLDTVWSFQSVMYNVKEFRAGLGAPREHIGPLN